MQNFFKKIFTSLRRQRFSLALHPIEGFKKVIEREREMNRLDASPLFCLVRHPESEANVHLHNVESLDYDSQAMAKTLAQYGDPDITAHVGVEQAKQTAAHLVAKLQLRGTPDRPIRICVRRSNMRRTERLTTEFVALCETTDSVTIVSASVDERMQEYTPVEKETTFPKDINSHAFMKRVYEFYQTEIVDNAVKNTVDVYVLFGHSLFFSVCLNFLVCNEFYPSSIGLDDDGEFNMTHESSHPSLYIAKQRCKTVFQLPNCSITNFSYNAKTQCWQIYNCASIGHLASAPELQTGTRCVTQK